VLSKWHPRLHVWQNENPDKAESEWPESGTCRGEIVAIQQRLLPYVAGFGRLAGVPNVDEIMQGALPA
jgi:hypothetical protein